MMDLPASLRRDHTEWTISRHLVDDLIFADGGDNNACAGEREGEREHRCKDCGLHDVKLWFA